MSTQPVTQSEVTALAEQPDPRKFSRSIQPTDDEGKPIGSPHVYYGATEQELLDNMAKGIANQTKKIRELSRKTTLEPQTFQTPDGAEPYEAVSEPQIRDLTPAEKLELSRKFSDPEKLQEAFDETFKARTGLSPAEQARNANIAAKNSQAQRGHAEANAFAQAHPEFIQCRENADAMMQYIGSRKMALTVKNFEIAFSALKESGLLILREPEPAPPSPPTEVRTDPPKVEASQSVIPSAMTRSSASGSGTPPRKKGPTARELAMMTATELKEYYESTGQWPKK